MILLVMDLSNLKSQLPPPRPVSDLLVDDLSRDITVEFKNAARSVAALYKLSDAKGSLLRHRGYLDAIDDLLERIGCGDDIENWALTKRAELVGNSQNGPPPTTAAEPVRPTTAKPAPTPNPDSIPMDFPFTISEPCPHTFRPSFSPLSVQHTRQHNLQQYNANHHLPPTTKKAARVQSKRSSDEDGQDTASDTDEATRSLSMYDEGIEYGEGLGYDEGETIGNGKDEEVWLEGNTDGLIKRRLIHQAGEKKPRL